MTPERQDVEEFARRLIRLVRDEAIAECRAFVVAPVNSRRGKRWRAVVTGQTVEEALNSLIPDIVDETLFRLLDAVDNDRIPLAWRREDGSWVSLEQIGRGEMAGWLMSGKGGWIDRFSKEPYFDYLADLP